MFAWLYTFFFLAGAVSFGTYLIPTLIPLITQPQNLKKKYNAEWALVTGGSSGIGRAYVQRLASQGINIVMVALDDDLLKTTAKEIGDEYNVQVRAVGVDLSDANGAYMQDVKEATKDISVQLLFNNAGYVKPGVFALSTLESLLANNNTNSTCHLIISHHFLQDMIKKNLRGLVVYTSSSAGFLPNPCASLYSATKAYLSTFAASIAPELAPFGIDVCVVHPSPIASNFYKNAAGFSVLENVKNMAAPPSVLADAVFRAAGRVVVLDQGWMTIGFRCLLKFLDWNFLSSLMVPILPMTSDYKLQLSKGLAANKLSGKPLALTN